MLQAEIAGRQVPSREGWPRRGDLMRDFQLMSADGQPVLLSEKRGRFNGVLVFTGDSDSAHGLLCELTLHQLESTTSEARPLAIVPGPRERASELRRALHLDFEVLADENGGVHRALGIEDQATHLLPAVVITDRFGEVFAAYKAGQGNTLPAVDEILSWIDFVNRQCPECGPVEWPA